MRKLSVLFVVISSVLTSIAQTPAEKIYRTEKEFEKAVAEKGLNAGFIEFMAPLGIMFFPEAANARDTWSKRPASAAALTWNPVWIDVSSNSTLAYSIGNSIYRPKGKDDPTEFHGHYLSVWSRQGNGEYRALLDAGINHPKPAAIPTAWRSPADSGTDANEAKLSAADSAVGFYETAEKVGSIKAYKAYLAEDVIMMRDGSEPFVGKKAALRFLERQRPRIRFAKRKAFVEAPDLAYVNSTYTMEDGSGREVERGSFVQVWKLRKGKWQIAADVWIVIPKAQSKDI